MAEIDDARLIRVEDDSRALAARLRRSLVAAAVLGPVLTVALLLGQTARVKSDWVSGASPGDHVAVLANVALLRHDDERLRAHGVRALRTLLHPDTRAAIEDAILPLVGDPSSRVLDAVVDALARLGPDDPTAAAALAKLGRHADARIAAKAKAVLAAWGTT